MFLKSIRETMVRAYLFLPLHSTVTMCYVFIA